ncbi:uncharacterized protein LOC124830260 [Vigna umbellata]|uniref:uncharacterized protein LOC124830260 n=1 Tax=Vigna umbellata TaxID=87088 RepID=UPI001F5F51BA|nr:uncharacterized protein LOC124830260 [Vigna umbellata]
MEKMGGARFSRTEKGKRVPKRVWLSFQKSMGVLVGGNHTSSRRVLLRSILLACAISIVSLYRAQSLFDFAPIATYLDCVSGFHGVTFRPASQFLRTHFWVPVNCEKDANLTLTVVSELTGNRLLYPGAKSLFVGEGSSMAVVAMKQLGFSAVSAVQTRSFEQKEVLYEDSSFDFVFSRDLDKVSVPALLVLEIERVLKPGGIGALIVGSSGSHPNDLIRAATPVSSLLRSSNVVHVDYVNELNLVVFKKRYDNATFYQHNLPADCPSLTFTKPLIELMEPLLSEKQKAPPPEFHKNIPYLPKFVDVSSRKRLVYIDIGVGELLNANVSDWFLPSYPIDQKDFNVYFVHYNTSIMLSYVKRPGITFVYHPGLAGIGKVTAKLGTDDNDDDLDSFLGEEEFDFLAWFRETVQYADFVVLKMNAGNVELKFLSDIFENGAICFVDELFLKCPERRGNDKSASRSMESCMDIYKGLRNNGVYVHQWWGD